MGLFTVQKIKGNELTVINKDSDLITYGVNQPWDQFLPYLEKFDQVFINSENTTLDEKSELTIEPHYMVAVTRVVSAIGCPRKLYVNNVGAEDIANRIQIQAIVKGNLLHRVFSDRISFQNPINNSIDDVLRRSQVELLTSDFSNKAAKKYLVENSGILKTLSISGETEIDCQNWNYGLIGKFDALTDNMVLELKSSKIPDIHPWPDHNIQMNTYLKMIDDEGPQVGKVIYIREGEIGIKDPSKWDHNETLIARNYSYLMYSHRYIPPVLRGNDAKVCRNCYVKAGCYQLCALLNTQRDCDQCHHSPLCDKKQWEERKSKYFKHFTAAINAEEKETSVEEFMYSQIGNNEKYRENLIKQGLAFITTGKKSEEINNGMFYTVFEHKSEINRFRKGDYGRAYEIIKDQTNFAYFHSVIISKIDKKTVTLESVNSITNEICLVQNTFNQMRKSRRALLRALTSTSPLPKIITDSFDNNINLPELKSQSTLVKTEMKYNSDQTKAMLNSLSTDDFYVIQGPAGTGKTSVIVEIINQLYQNKKRILCSAYTNMAIDNVGIKLKEFNIPFLRLGGQYAMDTRLRNNDILSNPELFTQIVDKEAPYIVLTTTSTISNQFYENLNFDYTILDEAAQMTEPESLKPTILSNKLILVGDHAQLPPLIKSDEAIKLNFQQSLFERLAINFPNRHTLLREQYRMNDEILSFPNFMFYNGKLVSASEEIGKQTLGLKKLDLVDANPYQLIAIKMDEQFIHSQINKHEGFAIVKIIDELVVANNIDPDDIAIITPFRAQVAFLRNLLPGIDIDTIDRFQGTEREIIIFSTITPLEIPISSDPKRMNVALTRAKKKLITLISNPHLSKTNSLLNLIYDDARNRNLITDINQSYFDTNLDVKAINTMLQSLGDAINFSISVDDDVYSMAVEFASGDMTDIFFNSIRLVNVKLELDENCIICLQLLDHGTQCIGCSNWYHLDHLLSWLKDKSYCPICKHTLKLA